MTIKAISKAVKDSNGGQGELGLDIPASSGSPKTYRVPVYRVQLQRDGSVLREGSREIADNPGIVAQVVRRLIGDSPQEHLVMLAVDARSRIIGISEVSRGTLSASLVHPRETFRTAILLNAAACIVAHNHPSGDCSPSADDRDTTRRLVRAGEILGIPLLDHVILGDAAEGQAGQFYSFREHGLLG
jgi:DNA repair protein RadC